MGGLKIEEEGTAVQHIQSWMFNYYIYQFHTTFNMFSDDIFKLYINGRNWAEPRSTEVFLGIVPYFEYNNNMNNNAWLKKLLHVLD